MGIQEAMKPLMMCNLCNARLGTGLLQVVDKTTYEVQQLPACDECVADLDNNTWIENGMNTLEVNHDD